VVNPATMASTLGGASFVGDGFGQPPVATGTATSTLGGASASMSGATDVSGVMDAAILPLVSFQVETRVFGVRVITVDLDNRTVVVPSRGVDD
jgi:hypothetical protein